MQGVKTTARRAVAVVAFWLDRVTGGWLKPDTVTWIGFVAHVPIAVLIGSGHFVWAAVLLVIFGLFDTLDGELARLQKRASVRGMLLDASTDRMKEVLLYTSVAYYFVAQNYDPLALTAVVVALGASMSVSYIKAKGEAAVASSNKKIDHATLNRMFADGILSFEIRMALLVVGLLSGYLYAAVVVIALGATFTAFQRLVRIGRSL